MEKPVGTTSLFSIPVKVTTVFLGCLLWTGGNAQQLAGADPVLGERLTSAQLSLAGGFPDIQAVSIGRMDNPRQVYSAKFLISTKKRYQTQYSSLVSDLKRDTRQSFHQQTDEQGDGGLLVNIEPVEPKDAAVLFPIRYEHRFITGSTLLTLEDPAVALAAKQAVGKEERAYFASEAIRRWIHQHIRLDASLPGVSSAATTMQRRSGNPADMAVLYSTMSRSMGIPARAVVGMEYTLPMTGELGAFTFHVWNEAYMGEWIAVDTTHTESTVDSTHIKFFTHDLVSKSELVGQMAKMADLMRHVKLEIVSANAPGYSAMGFGAANEDSRLQIPKVDMESIDIRQQADNAIPQFSVTGKAEGLILNSVEGWFTRGVESVYAGEYAMAREAFQASTAQMESPWELWQVAKKLAALKLYTLADEVLARPELQQPILKSKIAVWRQENMPKTLLPVSEEAVFSEAMSFVWTGNLDAAKPLLDRLKTTHPNFSPLYLPLAEFEAANGRPAEAVALYQQYQRIEPKKVDGLIGMTGLYMSSEDFDNALKLQTEAARLLENTQTQSGRLALTRIRETENLLRAGQFLNQHPKSVQGRLELGNALLASHKPGSAKQYIDEALSLQPGMPGALVTKLEIAVNFGDWALARQTETALIDTKIATLDAMSRQRAYRLKGYYKMRQRKYPEAISWLKRALKAKPDDVEAAMHLVEVYERLDREEDITLTLKQAMAVHSSSGEGSSSPLIYRLADVLMDKDLDASQTLLSDLLEQDPDFEPAYALMADVLYRQGKLKKAHDFIRRGLLLNPKDPDLFVMLGEVYAAEENISPAIASYKQALALTPDHLRGAKGLAHLIETHDLYIEPPKQYRTFSGDETDYLIQLNYQENIWLARQAVFFDQLAKALARTKGYKVQSVRENKALLPLLNKYFGAANKQYQTTQAIKPPARMTNLHYLLLESMFTHLEEAKLLIRRAPFAFGEGVAESLEQDYNRIQRQRKAIQNSFEKRRSRTVDTANPAVLKKIALEAGATGSTLSKASTARSNFESALKARQETKSGRKNSGGAVSLPGGGKVPVLPGGGIPRIPGSGYPTLPGIPK